MVVPVRILLILLVATSCFAQSTSTGKVFGKIHNTEGDPLSAVRIILESDSAVPGSTVTNAKGNFRFTDLPPGKYSLTCYLPGYEPVGRKSIVVSIGSEIQVDIKLDRASSTTGNIFGTVTDKKDVPVEGVSVILVSTLLPEFQTTTGSDGTFRFEGLPAGKYLVVYKKKGFVKLKPEHIELPSGGNLQLNVQMVSKSRQQEPTASIVQRRSSQISWNYSREYMRLIPNSDSIYGVLDQTLTIDSDTISTVLSDPDTSRGIFARRGKFPTVFARGADNNSTIWNYDGLNITVSPGKDFSSNLLGYEGFFPSIFDLENAEEVQIITAGNDISIPTGGATINIVSRQAGRDWHGSGSFFSSDPPLQSDNTPQEVRDDERIETTPTSRVDSLQQYSFHSGGPIIQDKLFLWGSIYRGRLDRINIFDDLEQNESTSYSLKGNLNLRNVHQIQFDYLRTNHRQLVRFDDGSEEEVQHKPQSIVPGIWSAQYNWNPENTTSVRARYGYIGAGFSTSDLYEQSAHDVSVEANRYVENRLEGDHLLRFGFEYKVSSFSDELSFDSYYAFSYEDDQALPGEPLTTGFITVNYPEVPKRSKIERTSLYVADSYRRGRLSLDLGLRLDRQSGENHARSYSSPLDLFGRPDFLGPGFEELIPQVEYPGKDPGVTYDDFSPRINSTYDLTGNGTVQLYASFAKYAQPYERSVLLYSELFAPQFTAVYNNANDDQVITPDEVIDPSLTNFKDDLSKRLYASDLDNGSVNEYLTGLQMRFVGEMLFSATLIHRLYKNFHVRAPLGITEDDFELLGTQVVQTPFGDFVVPFLTFSDFLKITGNTVFQNSEDWNHTYDGLELVVQKEMSRNFFFRSGLLFQRQRALGYSSAVFVPFIFDPGQIEALDPVVNYAAYENRPSNFYSAWQWKSSGAYRFPWGVSLGAFFRYQQGFPMLLILFTIDTKNIAFGRLPFVNVEPLGKRRLGNIATLDLLLNKEFHLKNYGSMDLILEIRNVTNANTVTARGSFLGLYSFNDAAFIDPNPILNSIQQFLSPRLLRLGLRYSF